MGKISNDQRKLEFILTINKLQDFEKEEVASFLGVTRQAIQYHKQKEAKHGK